LKEKSISCDIADILIETKRESTFRRSVPPAEDWIQTLNHRYLSEVRVLHDCVRVSRHAHRNRYTQFSTRTPGIRTNSFILFVTTISPSLRACAPGCP
jgi:hypothetical protein